MPIQLIPARDIRAHATSRRRFQQHPGYLGHVQVKTDNGVITMPLHAVAHRDHAPQDGRRPA